VYVCHVNKIVFHSLGKQEARSTSLLKETRGTEQWRHNVCAVLCCVLCVVRNMKIDVVRNMKIDVVRNMEIDVVRNMEIDVVRNMEIEKILRWILVSKKHGGSRRDKSRGYFYQ